MSSTVMRHDFQVISEAEYVPMARREAAKVLADWGMFEEVVGTACLIISELVTHPPFDSPVDDRCGTSGELRRRSR